ncbi:ubiquitin-conjugating enzyme/RWD-like protein [Mucor lusitanicus]|uniref:Ubiquitin-conjugating enzyme/RWD-like protein n=1 Tax=Mucor circinelloides f. lusitanicus TaxID=29924 RepID=A0A8H4B5Y7_MUCCL|nr:ubiquitin-conjugating enzyme/RWD-like protein [Mucor lusitanicus]
MTEATKYNLKNPGVKRIMQEAKELASESTYEYSAHPLEDNIFEWHFTVRGPKDTDFEEGRYHGRIILPSEYPFKPPELIFLTPNGRFELNTKICLSITGFHPEFWQPAWGIRTVLLAVIGFFPTEARGAIGGLDYSKEERRRLAKKSIGWICPVCEVNTKDALSDTPPDVPSKREELPNFMMTYKPEHGENQKEQNDSTKAAGSSQSSQSDHAQSSTAVEDKESTINEKGSSNDSASMENGPPQMILQPQVMPVNDMSTHTNNSNSVISPQQSATSPLWLDALIAGLVSFIAVLVCRRYVF